MDIKNNNKFRKDLCDLINSHSVENGSNTPDYILADYLIGCIENFESVVDRRDKFYDHIFERSLAGPRDKDSVSR